jgi:5-hydroxyisourate hydrolase-like protein (transthyretin family)
MLKMVAVTALLVSVYWNAGLAQVVQIGPTDPDDCYKIETILPNLKLGEPTHVLGSITDQSGAPFKDSPVELRKYVSQRKQLKLKVVLTDANGHFDLGTVKAGDYRLLPSPTRAFQQPSELKCTERNICELKMALKINPTDQFDSNCPVR